MNKDFDCNLAAQDKVNEQGYNEYINGVDEEPIKDYNEIIEEEREKNPQKAKITDTIDRVINISLAILCAGIGIWIILLFLVQAGLIIYESLNNKAPSEVFLNCYQPIVIIVSIVLCPFVGKFIYNKKEDEKRRRLFRK